MICCVAWKNENQSMNLFVDNMIISNECEKTTGKCQEKNLYRWGFSKNVRVWRWILYLLLTSEWDASTIFFSLSLLVNAFLKNLFDCHGIFSEGYFPKKKSSHPWNVHKCQQFHCENRFSEHSVHLSS